MDYLNERDWTEFYNRFKDANNWLIARSLENEYQELKNLSYKKTDWQQVRYEELTRLRLSQIVSPS